jgi:hypothetical protein
VAFQSDNGFVVLTHPFRTVAYFAGLFSVGAVREAQARQRAASSDDRAFFVRFRFMIQKRAVTDRAYRRGRVVCLSIQAACSG